ncbi:dentin sialophosphoprotein-like [Hibiscus syriacus]|uniref:Dentin sialophosphoprotein-like n=1 Tax=Hibiscus syriacus TaxID=106335 RepID=A0A6A3B0E5_HIBSY|nr:uncharacterized protein LOC120117830 [Hibiscus syriacus]KAE8710534.1 dentin sialophosphoprotein-like [Hibiscus syriacus]
MESQTPNAQVFPEDYLESTSSTPYGSAPSSPGRAPRPGPGFINGGFFYSAPASPMHFAMTSSLGSSMVSLSTTQPSSPDFEFSARFGSSGPGQTGSMSSADELFLNGKIRPMKLSTHLERPQALTPLLDLEHEDGEEENLRGRDHKSSSLRRRTRSMSPLRTDTNEDLNGKADTDKAVRSSKRWVFLKDFLRTKNEGRSNINYYKLWSKISFYPAKGKKPKAGGGESKKKPMNGIGKKRVPPSPHELLYTANRAQAEELRKKTYLPYRQGLLGCLGFSSKGYRAMNGLARALNQVN